VRQEHQELVVPLELKLEAQTLVVLEGRVRLEAREA